MMRFIVALLLLCNAFIAVGQTSAGEYVSIDGLRRSLGVNMRFKLPEGWSRSEAKLPHVVKSFYNMKYGLAFNIVIVEYPTFISRNEFRSATDDYHKMNEKQIRGIPDVVYYSELSYDVTTIDQYPFIVTCFEVLYRGSDTFESAMNYIGIVV